MGLRICDIGRPAVAWRGPVAASIALACVAASAQAKTLKLPADHPSVVFDVPDDWTIETTATGTEMRSPEKNAIVVAKVIKQDKATAEAFAKKTVEALKAFGVTFAADAKVPPKPAAAPDKPKASDTVNALQPKSENFTFSGSPSLALPGTAKSNDPQKTPENSVESLTGFGATVSNEQKLPLRAAQYFGTTLNGQPVDVQFVLYRLPDKHYFAMMQESGADDGRTVAMAQSVKAVK